MPVEPTARRRTAPPPPAGPELPVLPAPPRPLRADAERNRVRVLDAAAELFAEHGPEAVTLDDVVASAGVGKGTLYRIFTDKSGLAAALLDERERELQQRVLSGPPPLGPGATPAERLAAFLTAYVRYVAAHAELVRMSQTARPGARFDTGSHRFWRTHLRYLYAAGGAAEADIAADVLLAAMTAEQVSRWTRKEGLPLDRVTAALTSVAQALLP